MKFSEWNHNGKVDVRAVQKILKARVAEHKNRYRRYDAALASVQSLHKKYSRQTQDFRIKDGVVTIGGPKSLDANERVILRKAIRDMIPWRKGPFDLFGERIDAEWRSDLKWARIKKHVGPLQGKAVLDVGCNNGYYLFQMAKQKPKFLLGIDPVVPYLRQYELVSGFSPLPNTDFKLFGVEDLTHFTRVFDVVFCMGILYHHTDPIGLLKLMWQALRPGGMLIVESLGIDLPGSYFLLPESRYLGMSGHWFIPTREGLMNLVRRAGFQYVSAVDAVKLSPEEQRRTELSPHESLVDGLGFSGPADLSAGATLTTEGYPAPWRFCLKMHKARRRR